MERIRSEKVTLLSFPHRRQGAHLRGVENKRVPRGRWMDGCRVRTESRDGAGTCKHLQRGPQGASVHIHIPHPTNSTTAAAEKHEMLFEVR